MTILLAPRLAMAAVAIAASAASGAALAVDQPVEFGAPTVLSQQGQRLKVVLPVRTALEDRATASAFMVRETEVPQGYPVVPAQDFTVMRPAEADYVVFQSDQAVNAPTVSMVVSVAGDPRSPYRMDLQIPPARASSDALAAAGSPAMGGRTDRGRLATRKLRGPAGDPTLPPK